MGNAVIRVENLGKLYRIGKKESYKALRDTLAETFAQPFRRMRALLSGNGASPSDASDSYIWALKGVSLEVKQGEVIGIIGRNGAGKSTLLKILSRITEPTEGYAEIRGRVRSLLEVGTGFHPELTGRENIFLNGAILGMRKAEINRKFDEIVAFAEVEKFLDTPVKHYSSGMYVRMAFAVAAHLEPEILMVDEVLAVGDAAFQKKCLNKMDRVSSEGRTVIIVSHNLELIQSLCQYVGLLDNGNLAYFGDVRTGLNLYRGKECEKAPFVSLRDWTDRTGTQEVKAASISLFTPERGPTSTFYFGEPLGIEIELEAKEEKDTIFVVGITTSQGFVVCDFVSVYGGLNNCKIRNGDKIRVLVPDNVLVPGQYFGSLWIGDQFTGRLDYVKNCFGFEIVKNQNSPFTHYRIKSAGNVFLKSQWQVIHRNN